MSIIHDQLDNAKQQVIEDKHTPPHVKDTLIDLFINLKAATNGNPNKLEHMASALAHMGIIMARHELITPALIEGMVEKHTSACPLRSAVGGKWAKVYPFRWPAALVLCVALVSPYVGPVVAKALEKHGAAVAGKVVSMEVKPCN